jgi:uncharacterized protein
MPTDQPTGGERHLSIDAVRGFAVLGILLMNIVGMGLPAFAYINPVYAGGHQGADLWTWAINNVLTDGKMRGLFTMLFGASTILIAQRAEGGVPGPWRTHYSRMFWLLVIGMLHAYLFWFGDILVCYALAGLVIFPFRRLDVRVQFAVGAGVLAALFGFHLWETAQLEAIYAGAQAPGASAAALKAWNDISILVDPPASMAAEQIAGFGGGFMEALKARATVSLLLQTTIMPTDEIPEAIGQMFIGMALFRTGFFTLGWSTRAYGRVLIAGYLMAAPATAVLAWLIWKSGFEPIRLHALAVWQAPARPFVALAHGALLLLIVRSATAPRLIERLAAAGRMAFSNYLMTSVITTLVFCGFGLGLYGQLSRFEQLGVVVAVWAFILLWSKPWLARFHYGPFEWAWRSLVKWSPQPFVRRAAGA